MNTRDTLNYLRWGEGSDLSDVEIEYIHRGAPGDTKTVMGNDVVELGRSFLELAGASIPYHRITAIRRGGETLFQRRGNDVPSSQ